MQRFSSDQILEILALSPNATAVYTGEQIEIQMSNDAMIRFWGKDRSVVGMTFEDAIPELKGQPFIGLLKNVWHTGVTYTAKDTAAQLKVNGVLQTFFFDFVYEAIKNEKGEIISILHTATDVTERNINRQELSEAKKNKEALSKEQELNEQLAATIEELRATNEELFTTQKKLYTLTDTLEEQVQERTKELIKSEASVRFMIEDAPVAIANLKGRQMVIDAVNPSMLAIWGKTKDILSKPLAVAMPELVGQSFLPLLDNVFVSGKPYFGNDIKGIMIYDGKEQEVYTNFVYKPIKNEQGETTSILVVANVVTEQVLARKAVENSRHMLQNIVMTTPVGMTMLKGTDLVIDLANQPMLDIWQRTSKQVIGKKLIDVFPELKGQPFPKLLAEVFTTGKRIALPEIAVDLGLTDGTIQKIHVNFSYDPILDQDGAVGCILATVIDVTDVVENRKHLEQSRFALQEVTRSLASSNEELAAINEEMTASNEELVSTNRELVTIQQQLETTLVQLAESEMKLRYMLAEAPVAIALFTGPNLLIESANKKVLEVWGKTSAVIGMPLKEAIPELMGQQFLSLLNDVFTSGQPCYGNEVKALLNRNGSLEEVYTNFVYYPLKNVAGKTTSIMLVANVVTETVMARKKAEQAEENLRLAVESADLGTFNLNLLSNRITLSKRSQDFFGFLPDEKITLETLRSRVDSEFKGTTRAAFIQAVQQQQNFDIQYSVVSPLIGEKRWLRATGKAYIETDGTPTRFLGIIMDVTERKKDEERKNDFIGMVSHELKTPLTSLSGYVQVLQLKAKKTVDTYTANTLDKVFIQIKRMTTMINGFLNVSRLESAQIQLDKTNFLLDDLVQEMIEEAAVIQPKHTLTFIPCQPISVYADKDKIGNVISNLISNAIKYSPNDRSIVVRCEVVGNEAHVSVKDNGIGIKPEDQEKLFDRYYRVKGDASISGFGIGLYLSAEIIHRHEARIWVESEIGKGSTFYFSLPLN